MSLEPGTSRRTSTPSSAAALAAHTERFAALPAITATAGLALTADPGESHAAPRMQNYLGGVLEILEVRAFHFRGERLVLNNCIQLVVSNPACDVQIARADA